MKSEILKADKSIDYDRLSLEHYRHPNNQALRKIPPLLQEVEIQYFLKQMVNGLSYLHKEKMVMHRDIKPENILLQHKNVEKDVDSDKLDHYENYKIRIADFGLAKCMEGELLTKTTVGTRPYKCPEIVNEQQYSYEADIWAVGVLVFEMVTHYCIFYNHNGYETKHPRPLEPVSQKTKGIDWSFLKEHYEVSDELVDLISGMLNYEPADRLKIEDILQHPFITKTFQTAEYSCFEDVFLEFSESSSQSTSETLVEKALLEDVQKSPTEENVGADAEIVDIMTTSICHAGEGAFEEVGLSGYTKIKDEVKKLEFQSSTGFQYYIQKGKNSKILIILTNETNRTFYYTINDNNRLIHSDSLGSSQVRYWEIENLNPDVILLFDAQTWWYDDLLNYMAREPIQFKIEIYLQDNE